VGPGTQGAFAPAPDITHLTILGSQLILDGSNFDGVTHLSLKDLSNGSVKPFNVISATFSQLISESLDAASIPMNKALELILSNAYGQSTFPVTFSLQPNSVDRTHIKNAEVTLNKLNPGLNPLPGDVIKWDGTKFIMSADTGGGGGGGGSISLGLGSGLTGSSNPIIDSGMIAVDTGITGDPTNLKIPFFNSTNQLELAESAEILFSHPTDGNYSLFNNFGALTIQKDNVTPAYFIVNKTGTVDVPIALRVAGKSVCLGDGAGCPGAFGSSVTNITVTPPLTGGGSGPTVNISPGAVNTANNLLKLDGTGAIPIGIKGVVNSITAGSAISVTPASIGAVTVGVVFGSGNAQRHQTYLDNLGTLNPNDNYVVIGNGTSWEVQGGDSLLTTLGAQKADADLSKLAGLTPYSAPYSNMIVGSALGWITQQVPICTTGNVVIGDGNFLSCSPNTWNFSGGTLTSNNQLGMQLKAPGVGTATGELHFLGTNNTNYVGLKAADATASNTVWTLPATDGTSGYALTTDGSGKLSWLNVGAGNDVSNPGTSTMGNLALFSSGTGKVIQDSGIISADVVTNSGISLDNAIPRFSGTMGTIIQNSGVTLDGSNNVSGIQNLTVKGSNTSTPATLTSAVDFMTGRNSAGVYNAGQTSADLAFEQGVAGGGFKHYISTTHNNVAASNLNSFRFYLNNSTTAAGSSLPGTGNVLAMTITPLGVGILNSTPTNALDVTGNTVMTGSLMINNNGSNSYTFPTGRGSNGQVLTASGGAGAVSWATPTMGTVTGTGTDSHIMKWLGTTAAQDSGIIIDSSNNVTGMGTLNTRTIANWVDGPASATATNLASFVNGKQIQDSGLLTANIPTQAANIASGTLLSSGGSKTITDSGILAANVVTKTSNFSAPNRVVLALNNTSRIATETGYTIPGSVCGNTLVLKSDGTNMTCQADLNSGDVLGPPSSATNAIAKFSDGSGKILANSGIIIDGSNNVTGTNAFTSSGNMTVDSTTFFVDAANNEVGIGRATNDLYASLDVVGNIYVTKHGHASLHDAAEISNRQIGMKSGNTGDGFTGMQLNVKALESDGTTARANNSDIAFYTWIGGISVSREVARITERGRLGIGTANPTQALDVSGNVRWTGNGYLTGTSFVEFGSDVAPKELNAGKIGYNTFSSGSGSTGLLNIIGGGTTGSNRSTRFYDRVGIGMDPTTALDVAGNTEMTGSLTINNNGTNSSIFPTGRGTNGQVLKTNGNGTLSWANDIDTDTDTDTNDINGGWAAGAGQPNGTCNGRILNGSTLCAVNLSINRSGLNVGDGTTCTLPVGCGSFQPMYFYGMNKENNMVTWKVQGRTVTCVSGCGSLDVWGTTVFPL
jgi:hypothetical protein